MKETNVLNIKSVLLVDDDEEDFNFLNSAIVSLSPSVQVLRTGDGIMLCSIIETALNSDLIFLDINMPFRSGIACLKEIRSKQQHKLTRVIMYSTSCSKVDIDDCYNNGANFYLIKPSSYSCIQEQLKELFQNDYLIKNMKPPREEFVFYAEPSLTEKGHYRFNHQAVLV